MSGPRRWLAPAFVAAVVFSVRALVWAELESSPLSDWHLWTETDEHTFVAWSASLAGGNWLDVPPFRAWPDFQRRWGGVEFWSRFYPKNAYFTGPLYAYYLAGIRKVFGAPFLPARALELVLAVATAVVLSVAARTVAERRFTWGASACGVVAGLLYGLYGPLVFHDGFLYRDGMLAHVSALLLALPLLRPRPAWTGVLAAAAVLLKQAAAPLALAATWLAARKGGTTRARIAAAAAFLVPVLVFVGRNVAVGVGPLTFDTRQSFGLAWGNVRGADGTTDFPGPAIAVLEDAGPSTAKTALLVLGSYRGHWGDLVVLMGKKALSFLHRYEVPDNASFDFFAARLPALAALPRWPWLLGPGLVGLLAARRVFSKGEALVIAAAFATPLLACLLVQTTSRYRAAEAAPLALGAGLFVAVLLDDAPLSKKALLALAACAFSALAFLPAVIPAPRHRFSDALLAATLYERDGHPAAGAEEIQRYVRDGVDDRERAEGLRGARLWWLGARPPGMIPASELAPPANRFHAPPETFPVPPDAK